ncbi:hypothetical protein HBO10_30540 [Pseudomonas sp. WS 5503]|nr:hypothetical protein [Pseudomonas sp. WS 5503]
MPFRSLERGWRRGATRSSYRGRDQAGATDVILDIKRLLLSPGNTSILPENIVGQSLSVGFRPLPQTTPRSLAVRPRCLGCARGCRYLLICTQI